MVLGRGYDFSKGFRFTTEEDLLVGYNCILSSIINIHAK